MKSSVYALLHNESVLYGLNNITETSSDEKKAKEIATELSQAFFEQYDLPLEDFTLPEYGEDPNNIDVRKWISESPQSEELKSYMNKVIDIIEKKPNQVELYRELDSLLISAKEELKNDDVQKFQDSVLVAQRSYFLWFSEIDGQRSWFAELKKNDIPDLPKVTEDINWWKVFACDCVGGIFGGPAGYVAASLTSVIMQM